MSWWVTSSDLSVNSAPRTYSPNCMKIPRKCSQNQLETRETRPELPKLLLPVASFHKIEERLPTYPPTYPPSITSHFHSTDSFRPAWIFTIMENRRTIYELHLYFVLYRAIVSPRLAKQSDGNLPSDCELSFTRRTSTIISIVPFVSIDPSIDRLIDFIEYTKPPQHGFDYNCW